MIIILTLKRNFQINLFKLVRVRQRQEYHRGTRIIAGTNRGPNSTGVALFDDYAVLDRHSQSFFVRSLSHMVHAGSHGRQEYERPDDPKRESYHLLLSSLSKGPREWSQWHLQDRHLSVTSFAIYWHLNSSQSDCFRGQNPSRAWQRADLNKKWCSKSFWVPTKTKTCNPHHTCSSYRGRAVALHARWRNREASSPTRGTKWWGSAEIN